MNASERVWTLDVLAFTAAETSFDVTEAQLRRLDRLGVAQRDDPVAFDFPNLHLRKSLVGQLLERPGSALCLSNRFSVLGSLPS
ncbi:hypothetical protein [Bradyrhizobium sp. 27S5]|uniref:hypothetical protein n=1 Tax=Bradyrhizobium sp. 27S5 TaxID=3139728 RepID=UPI0030D2D66E